MIVWEIPCESRSLPGIKQRKPQLEAGIFLLKISGWLFITTTVPCDRSAKRIGTRFSARAGQALIRRAVLVGHRQASYKSAEVRSDDMFRQIFRYGIREIFLLKKINLSPLSSSPRSFNPPGL
jgi:hypothetical protein